MKRIKQTLNTVAWWLLLLFSSLSAYAQRGATELSLARQFAKDNEYEKSISIYKSLYELAPFDKSIYNEYFETLLAANENDEAVLLAEYMLKIRREDPLVIIDLGRALEASGKKKKADEQYESALNLVSGEPFATRQVADAFEKIKHNSYAVKVYESARKKLNHPYVFATELALLYGKNGNVDKAIQALMDVLITQPRELEDVKSSLLQLTETDTKRTQLLQKQIEARIKEQPDNVIWSDLHIWMFTRNGDYDSPFNYVKAIDKQLEEQGKRVLQFAQNIAQEGKFEHALAAFQYVYDMGEANPYREQAANGKLHAGMQVLEETRPVSQAMVSKIEQEFDRFFEDYPQYMATEAARQYAKLQARYLHRPDTAIIFLQKATKAANARKNFVGQAKLDIGDYYILSGDVWEATLTYSQVDKEFRQDILGEDARFRNAKLAYYRGDFDWAQGQLSVLKASTTELIANDALYLSVLITENTPPDSNMYPLLRFAQADLLLFQNKIDDCDQLLDSIAIAYPTTPLKDDIHMLRAKIAEEEGRYQDAVTHLKAILKDHADDVLADDAMYRLALIYEQRLKDKDEAIFWYESLLTEHTGSSFIPYARQRYYQLKNNRQSS